MAFVAAAAAGCDVFFEFRPAAAPAFAPAADALPRPPRLAVTGSIALPPLLAAELVVTVADVPVAGGGEGEALAGCVSSALRRSAKGESACWPPVFACCRAVGSAALVLTSGVILGALDTAALPGRRLPGALACNARASRNRWQKYIRFNRLPAAGSL